MRTKRLLCLLLSVFIMGTQVVIADDWFDKEMSYYNVYDTATNEILFVTSREVTKDDQYLSAENKKYKITKVNKKSHIAYAEFIEDVLLPEIDEVALANIKLALEQEEGLEGLLTQAAKGTDPKRKIAIYASHTDESYEPSEGTESIEGNGGILKVAGKLKENFDKMGVNAVLDKTPHDPHDAGAYKRSRRTALQLIRAEQPSAIIDVHRDGVPAEEYTTEINGKPAAKVRLVVGRRNQNFKANEEMAMKIKAVADKMYPGLIKDVFYAKGDYNQDLTPRAMLTEMGTYKHTRERAEQSTVFLSEVITTALFGGTFKDEKLNTINEVKTNKSSSESNKGSSTGIMLLIVAVVGGGILFLFLSNGSQELRSKASNFRNRFSDKK